MISDVRNKIRKLLNLSENDAATEGEIENALRFANQLMATHHIDKAEMDEHERDAEQQKMDCKTIYGGSGKCANWEGSLTMIVKDIVGSIGVYESGAQDQKSPTGIVQFQNGRAVRRGTWVFFGLDEEVAIACDLFDEMRLAVIAMARLRYGGVYRGEGRSYAEGFVNGIRAKLRADRETQLSPTITALVRVKAAEAKTWLEKTKGFKLRSGSSQSGGVHHSDAFSTGQLDGNKASFSARRTKKLGGNCNNHLLTTQGATL